MLVRAETTNPSSREPNRRATRPLWIVALACTATLACAPGIDGQLDEAQSLVAEGRPMAALPLLQNVVRRQPDDAPANLLLGQVLLQIGRTRGAFVPLQRALESERWAVPAGLLMASAHLRAGRPRPALETVNQILATHPDQPSALRIRATAELQIGSVEEALADARHILEVAPGDAQAPILAGTALTRLGRLDEAETLLVDLESTARKQGSASQDARACSALASFLEAGRRDPARAGATWRSCLERHPVDPAVLQGASAFFDRRGDRASSLAALRNALEHEPTALGIRLALAQRLAAGGDLAAGDRLLLEGAEQTAGPGPDDAATASGGAGGSRAGHAWQALANFRQLHGDLEGARTALDRAIEANTGEEADNLRFQRGMLLIDLGHADEARAAQQEVVSPTLADLLEGRLRLGEGDPAAALEAFERAVRRRPAEVRGRYWVGVAAQALGQVDLALESWSGALDLDPTATDAGLAAARLALALGDPARSLELLRRHRAGRGTYPRETLLLEARSMAALGQQAAAASLLERHLARGSDPEALALLAELVARSDGAEAALARLDRARAGGLDLAAPGALPALQAYTVQALAVGRPGAALAQTRRARSQHPDSLGVAVVHATALASAGDAEAAEATLRDARKRNGDDPRALATLGSWLHGHGQDDEALPLLLRAHELAPGEGEAAFLAAKILTARGRTTEAEPLLRSVVAANPLHAGACNDLAWLLAEAGRDLDLAVELARRAVRLRPAGATLDTLGWVQLVRGETDAALESLTEAVAQDPAEPGYRYRLGLALARAGRDAEAREAFHAALSAGPFPDAERARTELARLGNPD